MPLNHIYFNLAPQYLEVNIISLTLQREKTDAQRNNLLKITQHLVAKQRMDAGLLGTTHCLLRKVTLRTFLYIATAISSK